VLARVLFVPLGLFLVAGFLGFERLFDVFLRNESAQRSFSSFFDVTVLFLVALL